MAYFSNALVDKVGLEISSNVWVIFFPLISLYGCNREMPTGY